MFSCGMGVGVVHFAFFTRAMRFTLARLEMHLWTPLPPLRPEICAISGVGTISWFLLPCSTLKLLVSCQSSSRSLDAVGVLDVLP